MSGGYPAAGREAAAPRRSRRGLGGGPRGVYRVRMLRAPTPTRPDPAGMAGPDGPLAATVGR
jgi:hypothetical protein